MEALTNTNTKLGAWGKSLIADERRTADELRKTLKEARTTVEDACEELWLYKEEEQRRREEQKAAFL